MNVLLVLPYQYDLTQVKIFVQSLPPEGHLLICGPGDSIKATQKLCDRMSLPNEAVTHEVSLDRVTWVRSFVWQLDDRTVTRYRKLTEKAASEGMLLKDRFPSRFNSRKSFVLCTECNTLLPEDKHIDLIKHCANCCSDRKYLVSLTGQGVALVKLYNALGYHTLTPGGRKAWPYDEPKDAYLFSSFDEWHTCAERRRRTNREGEAKAARPSFRLREFGGA